MEKWQGWKDGHKTVVFTVKAQGDSALRRYEVDAITPILNEPMMYVEYNRTITLRHSATMTCGGITGHARECIRPICRDIIHENCTPDMIHYTREPKL